MGVILNVDARVTGQTQVNRLNTSVRTLGGTAQVATRAFRLLSVALVGTGFGVVAVQATRAADAIRSLNAQLTSTGSSAGVAARQVGTVAQIAQDTGSAFEDVAGIFARLQRSTRDFGASTEDVATSATAIQQSFRLSGASTQEAASSAVQLSQALSSGALRGEELNSILENNDVLAQSIRTEFNATNGELRALASQGQLISSRVFSAILQDSQNINEQFQNFGNLYSQSAVRIGNASRLILGEIATVFDEITGVNQLIAGLTDQITFAFRSGTIRRVILDFIRFAVENFTALQVIIRDTFNLSDRTSAIFTGLALPVAGRIALSAFGAAASAAIRGALFLGLAPVRISQFLIARLILATTAASQGVLVNSASETRYKNAGNAIGGLIVGGIGAYTGFVLGQEFANAIGVDEDSFAGLGISVASAIGLGALTTRAYAALSDAVGLSLVRLGNGFQLSAIANTRLGRIGGIAGLAIAGGIGAFAGYTLGTEFANKIGVEEGSFTQIGISVAGAIGLGIGTQLGLNALATSISNAFTGITLNSVFNSTTLLKLGNIGRRALSVISSLIGRSIVAIPLLAISITAFDIIYNRAMLLRQLSGIVSDAVSGGDAENVLAPIRERFNEGLQEGGDAGNSALIINQQNANALSRFNEDDLTDGLESFTEILGDLQNDYVPDLLQRQIGVYRDAINRITAELTRRQNGEPVALGVLSPEGRQTGGPVSGPGTGTSDSILARLSNGEFVINAEATSRYRPLLEQINSGNIPAFGPGGPVEAFGGAAFGGTATRARQREDNALLEEVVSNLEYQAELQEIFSQRIIEGQLAGDALQVSRNNFLARNAFIEQTRLQEIVDELRMEDEEREGRSGLENLLRDLFDFDFMPISMMLQQTLTSELGDALRSGDFSNIGDALLMNFSNSIIDNFASNVSESIFGALNNAITPELFTSLGSSISSAISGVLGDIDFGSIFMLIRGFFGFNNGGIVPNTPNSRRGVDSVPALLTPGERIIPAGSNAGGGMGDNVTVNLEVVGDVSASTRREILQMMPEIIDATQATFQERRIINA